MPGAKLRHLVAVWRQAGKLIKFFMTLAPITWFRHFMAQTFLENAFSKNFEPWSAEMCLINQARSILERHVESPLMMKTWRHCRKPTRLNDWQIQNSFSVNRNSTSRRLSREWHKMDNAAATYSGSWSLVDSILWCGIGEWNQRYSTR